jgi:hypothetical protein
MRVTRAQLLPLMVLLICMFGCKAGQVLRVVGVVAVTAVRVAAVAAAASARNHRVEAGSAPAYAESAESAEAQRRVEAAANAPGQCTEILVETLPPAAQENAPQRAAQCGGNVIIQDSDGHWRHSGNTAAPAIEEP